MNVSVELVGRMQTKITTEENISLSYAAVLAENALCRFDERVREGVLRWVDGSLTADFAVENISLADIQQEIGGSLFQALCVMDIFLKNAGFIPMAEWFERMA